MPKYSAAPPRAKRKPVFTSSKISRIPNSSVSARIAAWKPALRQDALGVAEDRLDDDRGDVLALALEEPAQEVDVVVAGRDDRVRDGVRDAAAPGQVDRVVLVAELRHVVRRDADQRVVVDAVVLALELHDLVAAGVGRGRRASRASSPRCRRRSGGPCRPSRSARLTSSIARPRPPSSG